MTAEDFSLTTAQVRVAQDGDRAALEDLFRRYLPRVARIVAARMGRGWRELGLDVDLVLARTGSNPVDLTDGTANFVDASATAHARHEVLAAHPYGMRDIHSDCRG